MISAEFCIPLPELLLVDVLALMSHRAQTPDDLLFIMCHAELNRRLRLPHLPSVNLDIETLVEEAYEEFEEPTPEDWEEVAANCDDKEDTIDPQEWIAEWLDLREYDEAPVPDYRPIFEDYEIELEDAASVVTSVTPTPAPEIKVIPEVSAPVKPKPREESPGQQQLF